VKEEVFEHLEVILETLSVLFTKLFDFSLEEILNLDQLMDAVSAWQRKSISEILQLNEKYEK